MSKCWTSLSGRCLCAAASMLRDSCRAYRAFEEIEDHPKLGRILVSFANPAKIVGERNLDRKDRRDGSGR